MKSTVGFCIVFLACFSNEIKANQSGLKILGGDFATRKQFPHQVALLYNERLRCSGSIISPKWVITAAHCVVVSSNATVQSNYKILAGTVSLTFGGILREIVKKIVHENHIFGRPYDDLALLKLGEELPFLSTISSIKLFEDDLPVGADVVVSGWGRTSTSESKSNWLKFNTFQALGDVDCMHATGIIHRGVFCLSHARNNGACFGDSGGSAVYNGKLAGIVSFVIGQCGSNHPDGFTKVSNYVNWVKSKITEL